MTTQTITIDLGTLRALVGAPAPAAPASAAPAPSSDDTIRDTYPAIVRTYADGVWVGTVIEERGCRVVITGARCIWRWGSDEHRRLAIPEVSLSGPKPGDRITVQIPRHICIDAVGITPITAESHAAWMAAPAYQP